MPPTPNPQPAPLSPSKGLASDADPIAPVTRRGPIFKLGSYPDKAFSLNADEARQAVSVFAPVPIDSEHGQSVFDGKLGNLRHVSLDGDVLYGEMDVPRWLHDLFPETPIPVSTTWHRQHKQIIGLALAANPRVTDAAMMSAFSVAFARHDTWEGQSAMQDMHDTAAKNGAICNQPAKLHSAHEASALQKIHDTAVSHGASCHSMAALAAPKEFSMDTERQGFLNWLFNGAAKPEAEIKPAAFALVGEPLARFTAPDDSAEVQRLKAALAQATADRITSDAAHFADAQIAAHTALPAEREAMIAAFTQAAQDDGAHGVVTFADGHTSSRVDQLTAMFSARTPHTLTNELITTQEGGAAAFAAGNKTAQPRDGAADGPMSADRRRELLGLTALGRDVIKNGNGS